MACFCAVGNDLTRLSDDQRGRQPGKLHLPCPSLLPSVDRFLSESSAAIERLLSFGFHVAVITLMKRSTVQRHEEQTRNRKQCHEKHCIINRWDRQLCTSNISNFGAARYLGGFMDGRRRGGKEKEGNRGRGMKGDGEREAPLMLKSWGR